MADPSPVPGGRMATRRRVIFLAVLIVLVLLAGAVIWWVATDQDRTVETVMGDGTSVKVTAPAQAGQPVISGGPTADPATVPVATVLLSSVVHIAAKPFSGAATVTMSYDPAKLPKGVDIDSDLSVMSYFDTVGMWLPVESSVDQAAHTVSGQTDHFSDWVVAVTDPEELTNERDAAERLNATAGGKLAGVMVGEQASLGCSSEHLLLAAAATPPPGAASKTCEDVLNDGSYRLEWVNTTSLPIVFDLPDGIEEDHSDQHLDVVVQRAIDRLNGNKHPHGAVVVAGGLLDLRFKDPAVTNATTIKGDIDWPLAFLSMERGAVSAALLKGGDSKAEDALDNAFDSADVYDCAVTAGDRMHDSGDRSKAFEAGAKECAPTITSGLAKTAGRFGGLKKLTQWVQKRVVGLLSVPDIMKTARTWISTLITAPFVAAGLDTSVTIRPTRLMSFAEAEGLPVTSPNLEPTGQSGSCQRLDGSPFLPPGMSDASACIQVVDADLDGNGKPDRLILWRPVLDASAVGLAPDRLGAVAYLDDGSYHLLDNPPGDWSAAFDNEQNLFDYSAKLHLHDTAQEQIYVSVIGGANTYHGAILAVGADRHLRAVGESGSTAPIADVTNGGGAGYTSSFGCVLSSGQNLFVEKTTGTNFGAAGATYDWSLDYYSFDDHALTLRGRYSGTSADNGSQSGLQSTPTGSATDCLTVKPTEVGPVAITNGGQSPPGP